ncbi:phosphohydrolase [Haladaptatus sp. W1]|uniref:HD domain-containing protein n=1 Tax=Haladaptatus sp. W1 TaxID=1897478 RepID=UPI000849861D|nr:HD domain-containing protein [Haladaptatus sp. W1]ODR79259.1 phosphohydrolase [Haladaptatus sp. W1]
MDTIDALADAFALKDERRTGWQLREVSDPESVAGHTWGVALLCLQYGNEADIDTDRALRMALVHDLAEAKTGDVATRVNDADQRISAAEKDRREREAMADLAPALDPEIRNLWEEYETRETPESVFVKDMDLVDMCLQALVYEREARYDGERENDRFDEYEDLDEFFATAEPRLRTAIGKELFEEIETRYEAVRDGTDE